MLLLAFEHRGSSDTSDVAEFCLSLWLVSRLQRRDAKCWERCFVFLIQEGFKRRRWNFDRMLEQAETLGFWSGYARYNLAVAFLQRGKFERARYYFDQVATLTPADAEQRALRDTALLAMGQALLQRPDYPAAATYFKRVRATSAQSPLAL